jgi:capsular exopolysaccharide synthesis family protein
VAPRPELGDTVRAERRAHLVSSGDSLVAEEYRSLRARIQSIRRTRPFRSLVLTSARPGEGKSTTAVNLALSFGLDLSTTTCLVDADLRTPSVQRAFPELPKLGLAELLQGDGDAKLDEALIAVPDTRLSVLPVRTLPERPAELLSSPHMERLLQELTSRFNTVLIDAPPVLGLPDAVSLVDLCDAALLVVRAGGPPRGEVEAALERLDAARLIGTVFNGCESGESPYPYSYYGYSERG